MPALARPNRSDYKNAKVSIFSSEIIGIAAAHHDRCGYGGGGRQLMSAEKDLEVWKRIDEDDETTR